jgi:hypothetical protein
LIGVGKLDKALVSGTAGVHEEDSTFILIFHYVFRLSCMSTLMVQLDPPPSLNWPSKFLQG